MLNAILSTMDVFKANKVMRVASFFGQLFILSTKKENPFL